MLESQLHLVSAILILLAAVVPIYITIRLKNNLRKLVIVLTIFILVHAVYHVVGFFGLTILAEAVFEPGWEGRRAACGPRVRRCSGCLARGGSAASAAAFARPANG